MGQNFRRHNLPFSGVFYAVPCNPLASDTVLAKMVDCMEHFVQHFEIFPKASRSTAYMYLSEYNKSTVLAPSFYSIALQWNLAVNRLHFEMLSLDKVHARVWYCNAALE